mmetsp:Transcript_35495/g.82936  ORF Transcript_35495/g.82936 Transcript_35495/m.82936 type:complete len:192 (-) Transcript_35495:147-722(-)|eukprot:CAMPEP_0178421596 /NCGR_PEP_ID=MMETSP0689_2-20121128/26727_1 /TAXON_ID=160604 /ORGANISM="Amphidinium massartii, Strain CS-259" /LENGTH=191 /DNA_ID=CAMNT_0020043109 /DNA_START=142 /DNA_END=717 /DNA_ORIENTATION=+
MAPADEAVECVKPVAGYQESDLKPARTKRADSPAQRNLKGAEDKETSPLKPKKPEATSSKPAETTTAPAAEGKRGTYARAKMAIRVVVSLAVVAAVVYFASQMRLEYGLNVLEARSRVASMMKPITGQHLKLALGGVGLAGLAIVLYCCRSAILAVTGKTASKIKGFVQSAAQMFKRTSTKEAAAAKAKKA